MRARGFTLVEVMVALAVVAIALPALLVTLSRQMDDTAYLRDKTLAQMVAANKLAETRLVVAATRSIEKGKSSGLETLAERDWYWWTETTETPLGNFLRMEIRVAQSEDLQDQPLYRLSAFFQSDLAEDPNASGRTSPIRDVPP